jgi:hypothetical protein
MHGTSEPDVEVDPNVARSREAGGVDPERKPAPDDERAESDAPSTTGTDENEQFVGRVAGQDAGYTGETGAEARARAGRHRSAGEARRERGTSDRAPEEQNGASQAREPAGAQRRHMRREDR